MSRTRKTKVQNWVVTREGERMKSVSKKLFGLVIDTTVENEKISVKGNRKKVEETRITIRSIFGFIKYVKHRSLYTYEYEVEKIVEKSV